MTADTYKSINASPLGWDDACFRRHRKTTGYAPIATPSDMTFMPASPGFPVSYAERPDALELHDVGDLLREWRVQ